MGGTKRAALAALVVALVLSGCASGGEASGESSGQAIDLESIDTGIAPEGPSVGELIAVGDFQQALGDDDLTLSTST